MLQYTRCVLSNEDGSLAWGKTNHKMWEPNVSNPRLRMSLLLSENLYTNRETVKSIQVKFMLKMSTHNWVKTWSYIQCGLGYPFKQCCGWRCANNQWNKQTKKKQNKTWKSFYLLFNLVFLSFFFWQKPYWVKSEFWVELVGQNIPLIWTK